MYTFPFCRLKNDRITAMLERTQTIATWETSNIVTWKTEYLTFGRRYSYYHITKLVE